MNEISIPTKGLPEELSSLEVGDDVHLRVIEKGPDSMRVAVGPCDGVEDDMSDEGQDGAPEGEDDGEESHGKPGPSGPMRGKGFGVLIMVGDKKK